MINNATDNIPIDMLTFFKRIWIINRRPDKTKLLCIHLVQLKNMVTFPG